ncbi:PaaI family thioesterase [Zymobacter palmae]|uniref:Putative oxidoreductase n=1 Tax=Zymobacter palmae TaxID=33074 RepID=A0A348HBZ9_9GAMM|nr:PaaI family thioesterase [Zymobacter palmae]BBG29151.1 putative oxidoreductase [Zymobacter palmae]
MTSDDVVKRFNHSALFERLGLHIYHLDDHSLRLHLNDDNPCHRGGFGVLEDIGINGSVISAAMEAAIGLCGLNALGGMPSGVIEFSMKLLRIVRHKPAWIEAQIDRKSQQLVFVSARLYSARDSVCATATGIVTRGYHVKPVRHHQNE